MQTKGDKTKETILNSAHKVFAQKGYSKVSMHDICVETGLSRGGLYRHFSSTKEIFKELLDAELDTAASNLKTAIDEDIAPSIILESYLSKCQTSIFAKDNGFFFATYEFAFVETEMKKFMQKRFKDAIKMLTTILRLGQETNVFKNNFNSETMAEHILFTIDSFQTSALILEISAENINRQIELLKKQIYK